VCREEAPQLRDIERLLGRRLPACPVPEALLTACPTESDRDRTALNPKRRNGARPAARRDSSSPSRRPH
jgi:ATP-dependent RNA helicase RhlE